jgi:hypothetical protein
MSSDKREPLAAVSHDIWSSWMRWMFLMGEFDYVSGTWKMPKDKVERWKRQMDTDYADLTEKEKESDRHQADKILKVLDSPPLCDECGVRHWSRQNSMCNW